MSSKKIRDLELFIVDIFVAIEKIKEYVKSFDNLNDINVVKYLMKFYERESL